MKFLIFHLIFTVFFLLSAQAEDTLIPEQFKALDEMTRYGVISKEAAKEKKSRLRQSHHSEEKNLAEAARTIASVNPSLMPSKLIKVKNRPITFFID